VFKLVLNLKVFNRNLKIKLEYTKRIEKIMKIKVVILVILPLCMLFVIGTNSVDMTNSTDAQATDSVDNTVALDQPKTAAITITNPTGASNWEVGTTQSITWTGSTYLVNIELYRCSTSVLTIDIGSGLFEEKFDWNIPTYLVDSDLYRIRIQEWTTLDVVWSPYFSIYGAAGPAIDITTPSGSTSWVADSSHFIYWDTLTGIHDVTVQLYKGAVFKSTIDTVNELEGWNTYWTIPVDIGDGTDYRIKVVDDCESVIYDFSDYFSITGSLPPNTVPDVDFTADTTTPLQYRDVQFTYTGSDGNPPLSYEWNFGDASPVSTDQNPIHTYTSAATYTVSLTVTDDDGDFDTETKTNYITVSPNSLPFADFIANVTDIILGDDINFTFTGDPGDTPGETYEWNFGDGSPVSNDQDPIYQYTSAGSYTVSVLVTDNNGDSDTETKATYISVTPDTVPIPDFSANTTNIIANQDIKFTYTGIDGNPPLSYEWNFGDASPVSDDQDPIYQYTSAGSYTVSVLVTDNNGDSDTETKIDYITVIPDTVPDPDFIADTTILDQWYWVEFTYTGMDGNPPLSYEWNFGDASPVSNDQDPIHQYTSAGSYTVSVLVTDDDGDSDTETKIDYITVNPNSLPFADFIANVTAVIVGDDINFTFTGDPGDTPETYEWDFGDGSPVSNDQNPIYNYISPGTYTVTLNITDTDTESDIVIRYDYIVVTNAPVTPPPSSGGGSSSSSEKKDPESVPGFELPTLFGSMAIAGLISYTFIKKKLKNKKF